MTSTAYTRKGLYVEPDHISVARVHDVPAAHEIARWINQEPNLQAVVRINGLFWMEHDTENVWHAPFGSYVVLTPKGFKVVVLAEEEDVD